MTTEQISELDVEAIKARFDAFDAELTQREREREQKNLHIETLERDLDKLRTEHAWMKRQLFGQKAEHFADPNQHTLGFATDGEAEAQPEPVEADGDDASKKKRRRGKRRPLPEDLPHVVRIHDLPEDRKTDPATGEALRLIGFEESKQLGFGKHPTATLFRPLMRAVTLAG